MKRIILTAGLFLAVCGSVYGYDDGDFQVWNTDVEEFKVGKDSKIALEEEFRWGDNAKEFYYQHYDIGFFHNLNKYWNVGGGYRQVYELKNGKFKQENEPYLTATLFLEKNGFLFDSRNRLEYRHFDFQADSWRYRNKFTLKFPWKITKIKIQPFLSDEILVGFNGTTQLSQNRLYSGLGMDFTKNFKAEIYYLFLSTKSAGKWVYANVLGTKLKLAF